MVATNRSMSLRAKTILWIVAINAFGGALSLLLFPTFTEDLFFWTITPPINARLLGALYLSGALAVTSVTLRGAWEAARFLVPVLVTAGVLISIVTLLHIDTFRPGVSMIYWLIVYIGAPLPALWVYVRHERPGTNWSVTVPITAATRRTALISGSVILLTGLLILVWPTAVLAWWPWPIAVLMLRIFAAWFSAFGIGLLWFRVERDWRRITLLAKLMVAASVLELLMLVLHRHELNTTGLRLWLYCAHLAGFGILGALMQWLQRPARRPHLLPPPIRVRSRSG